MTDHTTSASESAPSASTPPRRTPHPVLEQLGRDYPALFGATVQPLKRGIFQDLLAAYGDAVDKAALKTALSIHTRSIRYLQAMASGAARCDLQGQAVEATAPEHMLHAMLELGKRRKPRPGETPEQQQERLLRRIAQLFADSNLTREEFLARAQLKDEAAQAVVHSALDLQAEHDARAQAVAHAFAASGTDNPAAFAKMYGMHPQAVQRQLQRAEQLQAQRAAAQADGAEALATPQA